MRLSPSLVSVLVCAALAPTAACTSEDPAPVYLAMEYQLRCLDCEQNAADGDRHDIDALDGENGNSLDCFSSTVSGKRQLSFSARFEGNEFSVSQARIEGADPGSACSVQIVDSGVTYKGDCTSAEPTKEAPCRVKLDEADGIVKGSVYCKSIQSPGNLTITRDVVAPFTETSAAKFELHNCTGL